MTNILKWMGNKTRIQRVMDEKLGSHRFYIEPFAGGLGYGLKKEPSEIEVFSDYDGCLMNFWEVVQKEPKKLLFHLRNFEDTQEDYEKLDYTVGSKEKKASDYLILNQKSLMGDMTNVSPLYTLLVRELEKKIWDSHERLQGVLLKRASYLDVCREFDSRETVIFMDPPYYQFRDYEVGHFAEEEYRYMAMFMKTCESKVIVTLNDHPLIREIFKGLHISDLERGRLGGDRMKEIYIENR